MKQKNQDKEQKKDFFQMSKEQLLSMKLRIVDTEPELKVFALPRKKEAKSRTNLLIEFWNTLPNVRHHKRPETKEYRNCSRLIQQLREGTLSKKNMLSDDWLYKKKILPRHVHTKWTDKEIKKGMTRLSQMSTPGYEPVNKEWLKKMTLSVLIYNPRQQNSWFLSVMVHPPEFVKDEFTITKDRRPEVTTSFMSRLGISALASLIRAIDSVCVFYNNLPEEPRERMSVYCYSIRNERHFCLNYLDYLVLKRRTVKEPRILGASGRIFRDFLDHNFDRGMNPLGKPLSVYLGQG